MDASFYAGDDLEALVDLPNYQMRILDYFRPFLSGRVVEVGAGIGNIAERYAPLAREVLLLEPATNLHQRLQKRFENSPNVHVASMMLSEVVDRDVGGFRVAAGSFDAAVSVNVLEHVEDDAAMLRGIRQLLRPSGALLLFVPALRPLYGSLDALVGHHRRYHRGELVDLVEKTGFDVVSCRYFDSLGVLPWLLAGRVLRLKQFNQKGAELYDRWAMPLSAALDRGLWRHLGKNLVCVARAAHTS